MAIDMSAVPSYDAVFDILCLLPLKSACRFRCVSKGWCDLISSPVFAAAHKSHHGPLLVDAGSFQEEEPDGGRDMRLLDIKGNIVRVIRGVGGYGMTCNTSLEDLICVNGASCGGANVVDPATGKVLLSCPQVEIIEHHSFPYASQRFYFTFGFGRAIPSSEYKLVRFVADQGRSCEIFTLGDGRGWRQTQPSPVKICHERGSPIVIDGVMYVFQDQRLYNDDTLLCFDLESEQWKADVLQGPLKFVHGENTGTIGIRLTELNGALCIVQSVFNRLLDPFTNIWILDNSDKRSWSKAYTITMAPSACRYMPLWMMSDGGKLLLHCSFDKGCDRNRNHKGWSLVLQIYDPLTETCTDILGTPDDLAGRIGLCSFGFDHSACQKLVN
jgi:F-box interacting protein